MSKIRTVWSLVIVVFVVLIISIVYYFNNDSYALFSDYVEGNKTIELSISNKDACVNNANSPVLYENMIPVYFDESDKEWKKADKENKDNAWYDYCLKKWANIVTVKNNFSIYEKADIGTVIKKEDINTMFVWIPRYKYGVWNYNSTGTTSSTDGEILISFEKNTESTGDISCTKDDKSKEICMLGQKTCNDEICNGKTYTHPAFLNYTGFWVSKFEISENEGAITVLPNSVALRNRSVKDFNNSISDMKKKDNEYNFSKDSNISMINNAQWGAIAYLSNSKYGICNEYSCTKISNNNCASYITGVGATNTDDGEKSNVCALEDNMYYGKYGVLASTTANVYGVYDMSGGSYEYVMGAVSNKDNLVPGLSGYRGDEKVNNINLYPYNEDTTDISTSILGDAIKEVKSGVTAWNEDSNYVASYKWPFYVRGGSKSDQKGSGIFASTYSSGSSSEEYSTRIVITK